MANQQLFGPLRPMVSRRDAEPTHERSPVRHHMRGLAHVWSSTPIERAARLMASTRVKELVVLDAQGGPIGTLSAEDLVARHARRRLDDESDSLVADVMVTSVALVEEDVPIATAAARMLYTRREQLVVVDGAGIAVGCLTMNEVLRWLVGGPSPRSVGEGGLPE